MVPSGLILTLLAILLNGDATLAQGDEATGTDTGTGMNDRLLGEQAPAGRFPYVCSLRRRTSEQHVCGGTLIDPLWVVTAAHCVDPRDPDSVGLSPIVYCGIYDVNEKNENLTFNAKNTTMHPSWSGDTAAGYDIALIRLDREAELTTPALNVFGGRPRMNELLAALGWGEIHGGSDPDKLQINTHLNFVTYRTCNALWSGILPPDIILCAGIGDNDTCRGDSGGPLLTLNSPDGDFVNGAPGLDLLMGVTSFGANPCGEGTRPGVYTNVGFFAEWIQEITHREIDPPMPNSTPSVTPSPKVLPSPTVQDVIRAMENDNATTVTEILEQGLNANSRHNDLRYLEGGANGSLLHWTCRFNASESAKVLLRFGASLEARNTFSNAPLHVCAVYNASSVIEVLIANGADVEILGTDNYHPLHYASQFGSIEAIKILLAAGADIEAPNVRGETPLHLAARTNQVESVKTLLDAGADIEASDMYGNRPLHFAAWYGSVEVVEVLLSRWAEFDSLGSEGRSALHFAAFRNHLDVVEVLLNVGADLRRTDSNMRTVLHHAAAGGSLDVIEMLLRNGVELEVRDAGEETPLHSAAWNGHAEAAEILLSSGADVSAREDEDMQPLHFAAFRGFPVFVQTLLDNGADVSSLAIGGRTALHFAAMAGRLRTARVLVAAGAPKRERDEVGDRPEDVVCNLADPPCTEETRVALVDLLSR